MVLHLPLFRCVFCLFPPLFSPQPTTPHTGLETHVHNKTGRRAQICMKNQVGKCNMREKCLQIHGDWNMVEKLRQLYIADKKAYVSEVLAIDVTDQLGDVLSFRYSEIEPGAAKEAYRRNYLKASNKQVELCGSYVRTGACSYGTQCSAIHVSHERYVKAKALRAQPQQGSYKGGGAGAGGAGYGARGYHAQQHQHHNHHQQQHQEGGGRWGAEGGAGNGAMHYDDGCAAGGGAPLPADSAEMAEMVMRAMAEGSYDLPQEYAAAAAAAAAAAMQQQQRQQQQQWTAADLRAAEREEVNSDSNSSQGASWFQSNDSSHEYAAAGSSGGGAQGSMAGGSLPASVAHVSPNSFTPSYPTSPLPAATIEPVYAAPECTPYEAALAVERAAAAAAATTTPAGAPPVNLEENDDIQRLLNDLQLDFE